MLRKILLLTIVSVLFIHHNNAQNLKIGYANIELILTYMPESHAMNKALRAYQNKLAESLRAKENYIKDKYNTYQETYQANQNDPQLRNMEQEINRLQSEYDKASQDSENKLLTKREELLQPILDKLDGVLGQIQKEGGYDYILNSVDGNGVSIILKGPVEHDLTRRILKKLGIDVPE